MILGLDAWSGYGVIDWARARAAGVSFAYLKCTEGNEPARNDHRFAQYLAGCRDHGIYVGAYHFAYCLPTRSSGDGRSPQEEARRAYATCDALGSRPGELPPVVDAEWPEVGDWGRWGCDAKQISAWLRTYCEEASQLWQRKPMIYTYPFWWKTLAAGADVSWASEYDLWEASYLFPNEWVPPEGAQPMRLSTWSTWKVWQFSAKGSPIQIPGVPACPVDRNVFNGTGEDLRAFAGLPPEPDTLPELPVARVAIDDATLDASAEATEAFLRRDASEEDA